MLTQEEDVEVHALRRRGWSISAIARHAGLSRITVRAYLNGDRRPGERRRSVPDPFVRFEPYVQQRLGDDPHVWATSLLDELRRLGYAGAYSTFTEAIRERHLRPHCEPCAGVRGRPTVEIPHPPGEEIQWDFLELPTPWGEQLHLLKGVLSHSGKTRGAFCEREDEAHLIAGIDTVLRKLGGTARRWRCDRMAAVCDPTTGVVRASFAAFAKYVGVAIDICPPRRGNRKGVVEKRNDFSAQRWWRTADVGNVFDAQRDFDRFCVETVDALPRHDATVAAVATREVLLPLPVRPYPATLVADRISSASALVAYEGNQYGVSPGFAGRLLQVRSVLGSGALDVVTPSGVVVAQHRLATSGAGMIIRTPEQQRALEHAVLQAFSTDRPCKRKENRPPSAVARAIAAQLRSTDDDAVHIDLAGYAAVAEVLQ